MVNLLLDAPLLYLAIYQLFSGEYIMPVIVFAFSLLSAYKKMWLYVRTIALSIGFVFLFFWGYYRIIGYLFPLLSAASNLLQLVIRSKGLFGFELKGKEQAGQRKHYILFAIVSITGVMAISTLLFYEFSLLTVIFSCVTMAVIVGLMNVYIASYLTRSIWSSYKVKQLMAGYYIPYTRGGRKHPIRLLDDTIRGLEEVRAKLLIRMPTSLNIKNLINVLVILILFLALYGVFKWLEFQHGELNSAILKNIEDILKSLNNAGGELF